MTVLFCDLAGSTALGEELDPEALREVLGRYFTSISEIIARHGGTVQKFAGDAVFAVFGIPRVHEDDPLRAVRAASEIQDRLPGLAEDVGIELRTRIGVNTGLVVTDEGRNLALGDAVNVAARLEQAARPGEILLGGETLAHVRDAVDVETLAPLRLRGKSDEVAAHRLLRVDPLARGVSRRFDLPFVNRTRELAAIGEAWARARQSTAAELVVVLGAAGLGKSRLAQQFCSGVDGEARVLRGRCLHYGEGVTFWPLITALESGGADAAELVRHLSAGGAATAQELFLEVHLALAGLGGEGGVILYIDDLHWAEPMLLELLEHLVRTVRDMPLLILATARPELTEARAELGGGAPNATTIMLEPLAGTACEQLLNRLDPDLDPEARGRVIQISDGNPLFAEEMVALARDRGIVEVPPTISSLLAARIESLPSGEQDVLARAAVEGEVFHRSALTTLTDDRVDASADRHLLALVRKDMIRPHSPQLAGDEAFRFRHLLIRDAAYERLPRGRRAELHERLAGWLEDHAGEIPEHEELAAWHLEQAIRDQERIRRRVHERTTVRAAAHLRVAAQRAANRSDVSTCCRLLERGLSLAPAGHPLHLDLTSALAERLTELGDLRRADALLREAERDHGKDPSVALARLQWLFFVRPEEAGAGYRAGSAALRRQLADRGDERGLAALHMLGFWVEWLSSQATAAADHVRRAAEHAGAAGDLALRARAQGWYVATLIFGQQSAAQIATEVAAIEGERPGPYLEAFVKLGYGEVARLEGRTTEATRLTERAIESFAAVGVPSMVATCQQQLGWVHLRAGDAASARDWALRSDAFLREAGERSVRSTTQALLSKAMERLGDHANALEAVELAEALSAPSDVVNYAVTHEVRARLALANGEDSEAERWARSAVEHALRTDFPTHQAEARLALAEVLAVRGRLAAAAEEIAVAAELHRAKDDAGGLAAADALTRRLTASSA